jgi:hypothetical protein
MDARGLRTVGGCAAALVLLGATGAAQAATVTLGPNPLKPATMNGPPGAAPGGCGNVCLFVNTSAGGPAYIAPFTGVITTWRVNTGSASGNLTLRILRPAGGSSYTIVASSPPHPNDKTGDRTFTDPAIPVNDGDTIALENDSNAILLGPGATGNQVPFLATSSSTPDGTTMTPNGTNPSNCGSPPGSSGPCQAQFNVDLVESTPSGTGPAGPPLGTPPPPRPHLLPAPTLTGLRVTPSRFSPGTEGPRLAAVGARIRFSLNLAASVRLSFARATAGHRVGKSCRPGRARNRGKRCTAFVSAGDFSLKGRAGANSVAFAGRLSSRRALAAGTYRLSAQASANGQVSPPARASFVLERKR